MSIDDNFYMQLAIDEAWKYQLLTYPNPAVGCVIAKNGEILAIEAHTKANTPHAEVNAIKSAFLKKNNCDTLKNLSSAHDIHDYFFELKTNFFNDCEVFVTLEPCNHYGKTPPCASLLEEIKPKRVVIGHYDPNEEVTGGAKRLKNKDINVQQNTLNNEAKNLLYPFLLSSNKQNIVLFKIATRLNGSFDGGKITSNATIKYLHEIRALADTLAIGGNTVRIDKPTLDARYSESKKNPNILIFSKQKNFDSKIPLFGIKNRQVLITDEPQTINNYKFTLIEGGTNLLNLVYNHVNLFLFVVSVEKIGGNMFLEKFYEELELLKIVRHEKELLIWLKKKDI